MEDAAGMMYSIYVTSVAVRVPMSSTVILNFLVLPAVEDLSNKPVMYKLSVDARRVNSPVPAVICWLPSSYCA